MSQNASFRSCPAPRLPLLEDDCKLPTCKNDEDCSSKNQSCCFNGCIFTCVERLSPPPVIDWDNEVEAYLLDEKEKQELEYIQTSQTDLSLFEDGIVPCRYRCKPTDKETPISSPLYRAEDLPGRMDTPGEGFILIGG
ncbi:WAP domain-containing protein [Nephila pilipes]|uniref:WAP domain-containing protein n=1 Tax=Nephila pilipes TaxID=299642 RepID=A0A8X6R0L4_NEPPI|nr:WAP domain-containing protein [Nephila pilipes]